jgi:hypothetical protein
LFFSEQTVDALVEAIERFEVVEGHFDPVFIRSHVQAFDVCRFRAEMQGFIDAKLGEFRRERGLGEQQAWKSVVAV